MIINGLVYGKIYRKAPYLMENLWFPVDFPLNLLQYDNKYCEDFRDLFFFPHMVDQLKNCRKGVSTSHDP